MGDEVWPSAPSRMGTTNAVVGMVGYVFFGWRSGGPTDPDVLASAIRL